jgi:hypothetical protein
VNILWKRFDLSSNDTTSFVKLRSRDLRGFGVKPRASMPDVQVPARAKAVKSVMARRPIAERSKVFRKTAPKRKDPSGGTTGRVEPYGRLGWMGARAKYDRWGGMTAPTSFGRGSGQDVQRRVRIFNHRTACNFAAGAIAPPAYPPEKSRIYRSRRTARVARWRECPAPRDASRHLHVLLSPTRRQQASRCLREPP